MKSSLLLSFAAPPMSGTLAAINVPLISFLSSFLVDGRSAQEVVPQRGNLSKVSVGLLMVDVVECRGVDEETWQDGLPETYCVSTMQIGIEYVEEENGGETDRDVIAHERIVPKPNRCESPQRLNRMDGEAGEGGGVGEAVVVLVDRVERLHVQQSVLQIGPEVCNECADEEDRRVLESRHRKIPFETGRYALLVVHERSGPHA